ncbi:MAG: transcriptional regulator [Candidatus Magnetomorum sp.]|nr:transcriptional regulator [Candidatus Magnetomorum sp.]
MVKRIYKKYPNRRIYDTETSAYVTLTEVAETIKEGHEVQVVDVKRNEDVTALILTQIIMEQAKKKRTLIPVRLLHLFIQSGETVMTDFFENYFEKNLENFLTYRNQMEEQFQLCMALGVDFTEKTRKVIDQINPFQLQQPSSEH